MSQKTVIVWDELGQNPIKFAVVEKDLSHLNGVYLNSIEDDPRKQDELTNLIYGYDGSTPTPLSQTFPVEAVIAGAIVIVAGFLP